LFRLAPLSPRFVPAMSSYLYSGYCVLSCAARTCDDGAHGELTGYPPDASTVALVKLATSETRDERFGKSPLR
jgi:hypothetical protein